MLGPIPIVHTTDSYCAITESLHAKNCVSVSRH